MQNTRKIVDEDSLVSYACNGHNILAIDNFAANFFAAASHF